MGAERERLTGDELAAWRRWGPFVSEREWGTVREDYSDDGEAWRFLTHDESRSKAYRWGEDGLAAVCDRRQGLCLGLALWNGRDPILKERLFGLTGKEGNHGEDAKECWWYVDATPTHSWLRWRYHYPQAEFPYALLVGENRHRGFHEREYELLDTGVFDQGFWAVETHHAKAGPDDLCLRIVATNHGPAPATLHVLPTLWARNVWSWGRGKARPELVGSADGASVAVDHARLGRWVATSAGPGGAAARDLLFCENETNTERLYGTPNAVPYPKDGINDHVIHGAPTVNPARTGTKAAWWHVLTAEPGETVEVRVRFTRVGEPSTPAAATDPGSPFGVTGPGDVSDPVGAALGPGASRAAPDVTGLDLGAGFDAVVAARAAEADEFWAEVIPSGTPDEQRLVARQAFAGLLWSQQFYRYDVSEWLDGDPGEPPPPPGRGAIRNGAWRHLDANDVLLMPDKWEYPWFASWDLAFHCVALAHIDPALAKEQLLLLTREWYMHPNGQLPAYEWEFSDANPPVHAWAAMRVFEIDGGRDLDFLARVFHKLMLNFTWWVNRQDTEGNNVFEGGFLGLDNIGPFNRSERLPEGGVLEQSDGTGWMAMYALNLLDMALVLAADRPAYEDLAVKFVEHFAYIASAMNRQGLWDEDEGFFFDVVRRPDGTVEPLRIRSMVGLIPLFALTVLHDEDLAGRDDLRERVRWFFTHKPELSLTVGRFTAADGEIERSMLSIVSVRKLARILEAVLDEDRFLSPHGLRSLSRWHLEHPVTVQLDGREAEVRYEPGESSSGLFGGNSNWRGPVWFPVNFLVIEALRRYHEFLGDDLTIAFPTVIGEQRHLAAVADGIADRLISLFVPDGAGHRPVFGGDSRFRDDPAWADLVWFFEYFDGDDGRGLGASHQTGWTALVGDLIVSRHRPPSV